MGDDEDENDNIADDNDDNDANAHVINILLQIRELINGLINYLTHVDALCWLIVWLIIVVGHILDHVGNNYI